MKKLDLRLLRMIRQSKGQFISVTVIVAVALCIYITFSITLINIRNAVDHYYDTTNISDLVVELIRIPQSGLSELDSIPGITGVQGRVSVDVPLKVENEDEKVNIRLVSVPADGGHINKLYTGDERELKFDDNDAAVLLEQFAKARNIKIHDRINPRINGRPFELKVSGIASSSEYAYIMENEQSLLPAPEKFGVAYVSEAFAQSVLGYRGSYNEVTITIDEKADIDNIIDAVEKKLDKYGVKKITKLEDQLSNNILTQKIEGMEMMSSMLPIMFLLVAAIIISIMLSRIVNNDRMAIGVLKALGYGNLKVLSHYTKYALAIGLTGSITGIAGGMYLANPMSQLYVYYFNIPLSGLEIQYAYIINGILLTSLFCIISGLFGARSVIRIMPADSMRPEAPKKGRRILLERIIFIWKHVPFSWKMVIRNMMRNKRRFAFLVLGLALAYAINTVPLFMTEAIVSMFEQQYGEYQLMDYSIDFTAPKNVKALIDINNLAKIDKAEPKLEYPFELVNGWREKTVSITGIPKDTEFYVFKDRSNNTIKLPDKGIFITEAIARDLNVGKGDTITIRNFLPNKADVTVQVSDIFKQYLGVNAYMNIESMDDLLLDEQMITGVNASSGYDLKEKLKDVAGISSVRSIGDIKQSFVEFLDTMNIMIMFYLLFGGVLGFALIYNATIIGISERTNEFASLRIMGFDKKDVFGMITRENFVLAAIAIMAGIPLGASMIKGMGVTFSSDMITFPVLLTPGIFIKAALASVFFVIIAQLATLKKVYNLNFIDALKSRIS